MKSKKLIEIWKQEKNGEKDSPFPSDKNNSAYFVIRVLINKNENDKYMYKRQKRSKDIMV